MYVHVLRSVERGVQVHVGDVHAHPFCAWSGEDAVPVDFDGFEAHSFLACGTRVVCDEVTACSDPGSVLFFLLEADGAYDACIGNGSVFGNLLLGDEEDSIGAFDPTFEALDKSV